MKRIELDDGTHLTQHPGGGWTWFPQERIVQATFAGSRVTVTADGSPEEILAETTIVEKAAGTARGARGKAGAAAGRPEGRPGRSEDDSGRWQTLNEFVDMAAGLLTPAEQAVWLCLFRHCRGGRVEASTRGVAATIGIDPKTVTAALATLKRARLVWEIAKSTHRGEASVYGMQPQPARCREACEAIAQARRSRRRGPT